jgi:predicted transcriptional regulator
MDREDMGKVHDNLPVLLEVRDSGSLTQKEIGRRLGHPKSTTHRKIRWLEEMDIVRRSDPGYELTELGRFVADKIEDCHSKVNAATEFEEFLGVVFDSGLSLDDIQDADVTRVRDENPFEPMTRLAELVDGVKEGYVLARSMAPRGFAAGRESIRRGNTDLEIVVDSDIPEYVDVGEWFGDGVESAIETDELKIWVHDDIEYNLAVLDGKLCLGSEDENGVPDALLETTDEGAVEWAREEIERHKEGSERLTVSDI